MMSISERDRQFAHGQTVENHCSRFGGWSIFGYLLDSGGEMLKAERHCFMRQLYITLALAFLISGCSGDAPTET
ncbi:MAG TPA: hypothetical protein VMH30_03420, partial [Verrucomicrobiae bacterium]|nr:hypothetical protein [Verrucomicrobiae bacterium]